MTDLLKQLQDSFCNDLNNAWLKDIQNNEGENMNVSKFNDLVTLMIEAREQGYTFRLHYSSAEFIADKIMGSSSENDLYAIPEWQKIKPIINMIDECDKQQWDHLKPHLEMLKSQKVQPIIQQHTINFARKNGPFYPGKDNSIINVYGSFGSVGADLLLTTLVYGPKEKQLQ